MGRLMDALPFDQTSQESCNIAAYEALGAAKWLMKRRRSPRAKRVWDIEARNDIGDAFTMLKLACEQEGWDHTKITREGEQKFFARMAEYGKGITQ